MQRNEPKRAANDFRVLGQRYSQLAHQLLTTIDTAATDDAVPTPVEFASAVRSLASFASRNTVPAWTQCIALAMRIDLALVRYAVSRDGRDRDAVMQLLAVFERGMAATSRA